MRDTQTRSHYSRNILLRMFLLIAVVAALLVWQREFILDIYFRNQITTVGWVINGGIAVLFFAGLLRLIQLFLHYAREEGALNRFLHNIQRDIEHLEGISPRTIISRRYKTLFELYERRTPINHGALASTLMAIESSHVSFPKFVNNTLILTGVFGTIVSLSIALLGASNMLSSTAEVSGLNTVIHGMSTALSTTMTAILAYLFFGYFFLKFTDTQTQFLGRIEHVTATNLMAKFNIEPETVLNDFSELIHATGSIIQKLDNAHGEFANTAKQLHNTLSLFRTELNQSNANMESIVELLREGFRLPGGNK